MRSKLEQLQCTDGWRPELGTFSLADAPKISNNVHIIDVEAIPEAVEIANSPEILVIVSHYLGGKPTIDDILAWWSLPGRAEPFEEQYFHRDHDSIRFVKLFVYLSDVGEGDGAHMFVRGSHRSKVLLKGNSRLSDEQVNASVSAADVMRFQGPFGTVFLEDTYGLYKGEKPIDGTRLAFQVRFTLLRSIFATPGKKKARVGEFDAYVNRLIAAPQEDFHARDR